MNVPNQFDRFLLITFTLVCSWLGMQAVHELGHVIGAKLTGGTVRKVVLDPLTISRTDLAMNPHPLIVVWAGPIVGIMIPAVLWAIARWARLSCTFLFRFFAGFCLIANGLYLGVGSFGRVGDCGEILRHSPPGSIWHLWLFGFITVPLGFGLWNGQGKHFGLGSNPNKVSRAVVIGTGVCVVVLMIQGFWLRDS